MRVEHGTSHRPIGLPKMPAGMTAFDMTPSSVADAKNDLHCLQPGLANADPNMAPDANWIGPSVAYLIGTTLDVAMWYSGHP